MTVRVFEGFALGAPLLTVRGTLVFEGNAQSGSPLYTPSGDRLMEGQAISGYPLATLVGDQVFEGSAVSGYPLGTLDGDHAFEGSAVSGSVLVSASEASPRALMAGNGDVGASRLTLGLESTAAGGGTWNCLGGI